MTTNGDAAEGASRLAEGFYLHASGWGCCLCVLLVGALVWGAYAMGKNRQR